MFNRSLLLPDQKEGLSKKYNMQENQDMWVSEVEVKEIWVHNLSVCKVEASNGFLHRNSLPLKYIQTILAHEWINWVKCKTISVHQNMVIEAISLPSEMLSTVNLISPNFHTVACPSDKKGDKIEKYRPS